MKRSVKLLSAVLLLSFVGSALSACVVVPEREVTYYREPPHHYYYWR